MIVLYAEKEDMGIKFAAALGGIEYNGKLVDYDSLIREQKNIKKDLADKNGYLKTTYEGKEYVVTWGWGHFGKLCDVKDYHPEYKYWSDIPLPFIPDKFKVKRIEPKDDFFKKRNDKQFEVVKKLFNSPKCEYIINATDWEREGELIFAYVYDLTGSNKPYLRLRSNSKTKNGIRKEFKRLYDEKENYSKVLAARARSIADWTVGINMTIAATRFLSSDNSVINVGRVFTPTLNLITTRENEIRNFTEKTSFGIKGLFTCPKGSTYEGKCDVLYDTELEAKNVIEELPLNGTIQSIEVKQEKKHPPLLHNTLTLQSEANEIYGFTFNETLSLAQSLYEKGFITYPRVDSQYLTEDKVTEMEGIMVQISNLPNYKGTFTPKNLPKKYFDNSKIDGHDAIIATEDMAHGLNEKESKIYDLVIRRMIMAISDPAIIEKTIVITKVDDYEFKTNGIKYLQKGFMVHRPGTHDEKDIELPKEILEGLNVQNAFDIYEQISKPPKRYTESTLAKAMENCARKVEDETAKEYLKKSKGIGRPATRAAIIERLISAQFVERKKNTLYPTDKGMDVIDKITIDEIKSPILTASWEEKLDSIESAERDASLKQFMEFMKDIKGTTNKWCEETKEHQVPKARLTNNETEYICPICGGKLIKGKDNYFCSNYKTDGCKFSIRFEISGKKLSPKMIEELTTKGITKLIKGFTSKKGTKFNAKLQLTDAQVCESCNAIQQGNNNCYKCGGDLKALPERKLVGFKDISYED